MIRNGICFCASGQRPSFLASISLELCSSPGSDGAPLPPGSDSFPPSKTALKELYLALLCAFLFQLQAPLEIGVQRHRVVRVYTRELTMFVDVLLLMFWRDSHRCVRFYLSVMDVVGARSDIGDAGVLSSDEVWLRGLELALPILLPLLLLLLNGFNEVVLAHQRYFELRLNNAVDVAVAFSSALELRQRLAFVVDLQRVRRHKLTAVL